ncbi:GGDEF domain-containing protein [Methyloversatilis universalis]|uniref:GGDEF domain-containing protein n=1 Tax=Methyloversatilis universalis TaxID=378211 RepID=UPI0009DA99BE|nr:sensor domain-containing diguanylate cyclase [Methyloversatilis universalis]
MHSSSASRPGSPLAFPLSATVLTLMALFTFPVATVPLPAQPVLMGLFLLAVCLLNGLTAAILSMLLLAGSPLHSLTWVAAAYAFSAVMAVMQLLAFPGIFGPQPLVGGSSQAAAWVWAVWHAGFPLLLLAHVGQRLFGRHEAQSPASQMLPVLFSIACALLLGLIVLGGAGHLPVIMDGHHYGTMLRDPSGIAAVVLSVTALCAVVGATRLRDTFDRWLTLGQYAFTLDVVLALAGQARYSAGWYVSRAMSLLCAGALLMALLAHSFRLYRAAAQRALELQVEVVRDPLTGLLNRRGLLQLMQAELERAHRHARPLALLFIDMDHFKHINDTYGHPAGDLCLKNAALRLCAGANRHCDVIARYGGEEFVVLLPECDEDGARVVAERIRAAVEIAYDQGAVPCRMSVSIGLSTLPPGSARSADTLIDAADAALYDAKRSGRNRVAVAAAEHCTSGAA